jgi:hypothetical protein
LILVLLGCGTELAPAAATSPPSGSDSDTPEPADTGDFDPGDDEDFPFGDAYILDFGLELDADALAALDAAPREWVPGTFTFQGQVYDAAVHLKGSESGSFRTLDEKASFKVKFSEWDADGRFHGLKRLALNSMVQDPTMAHDHSAYWLYRQLGIIGPRHGYARISLNGEPYGLFGVVETMDDDFLERHWEGDDEGNLYEGGYGGDLVRWQEDLFIAKEGDAADYSDIEALVAALDAATPETFLDVVGRYFDVQALIGVFATELSIADEDGYTTLANNYYLYHATVADTWTMIPWGPDQAFTEDIDVMTVELHGRLAKDCRQSAACTAALAARIEDVLATWESVDLAAYVDLQTRRIESACREDPRSPWGDYGCRDAQELMCAWVSARPAVVRAQLP